MNIELSDQFTRKIEAAIGTSDPAIVAQILERMVSDEQLVKSFVLEDQTDAEIQESVAMCDRGMQNIAEGNTQPAKDAMRDIAAKHGLKVPE